MVQCHLLYDKRDGQEAPSRLDLGKDKYGGPFTKEEVEDVKTVFCMLSLFIGFVALNLSNDNY
uniref:Uncharacterized protein n=1 Tax=Amphimedon queenslandica TaxID=400682 RepID=A0A1X7TES3_AMPQE